jgi:hypothetical protein
MIIHINNMPWDNQEVPEVEGSLFEAWHDALSKVRTVTWSEGWEIQDQLNYKLLSTVPGGEEFYKLGCWMVDSALSL